MTQLILDTEGLAVVLPESTKKRYWAERVPGATEVEMISRRLVKELRGEIWQISYQYEYFSEDLKNRVIQAVRKGQREPITCAFLPPESAGELIYSRFWVESFKYPVYMWGKRLPGNGGIVPLWADFSLVLREVKPSD